MYFYYPVWFGSMSDPSTAPPVPALFVRRATAYRFRPERSTSFKVEGESDPFTSRFADDDNSVDYERTHEPDYVHPTSYAPPPPPNPSGRDTLFERWAYNRIYDPPHPDPPPREELPRLSNARLHPYGHPSCSHEYCCPNSVHQGPHWDRYPYSYSYLWTTATAAWEEDWQTKAKGEWEEWKNKAKENWEDYWEGKAKASRGPGGGGGRYRRGDAGPGPGPGLATAAAAASRSEAQHPRPVGLDSGWRGDGAKDRTKYAHRHYWYEHVPRESERGRPRWGGGGTYRPSSHPHPRSFSATRSGSEMTLAEAFAVYAKVWAILLSSAAPSAGANPRQQQLKFRHIPWPQYPPPRSVEDIDAQKVRAFLAAGGRSMKTCLREALLRFHPDKTAVLLARVVEDDKAAVAATCEAVTRCLGQLMKSATL